MADYSFGFKVSAFQLTSRDSTQPVLFNDPTTAPGHNSLLDLFADLFRKIQSEGEGVDESLKKFHNVLEVHKGNNYLLVVSSAGRTGQELNAVDSSSGKVKANITRTDALAWSQRFLVWVPEGEVDTGLMVLETRSTETSFEPTIGKLTRALEKECALKIHMQHDIASGKAWQKVFENEESHLRNVSFITGSADGLNFDDEMRVQRVKVDFSLEPVEQKERGILGKLWPKKGTPMTPAEMLNTIGGIPGSSGLEESLNEGYATAVVETDGKRRTFTLGNPRTLVRILEYDLQCDNHKFLYEVQNDILEVSDALGLPWGEALSVEDIPKELPEIVVDDE